MHSIFYDFHIHSALSPCADDDMTPNDIVGMALLNGLDMIAITDHNSLANAEAVIEAASGMDLIVLPGIEVSTAEEVHVICLFGTMEDALCFELELAPFYSTLRNRKDVFGNQLLYDANDTLTGEMERMLIAPTSISFDDLHALTKKSNGAFIPAHIDRESFSVLTNLGFLPPHLSVNTLEVSKRGAENGFIGENAKRFPDKRFIVSTDAHQLWNIAEKSQFITLPERSAKAVIDFLR